MQAISENYNTPHEDQIGTMAAALSLLSPPGHVVELRIPNTPRSTVSGYFTDMTRLAKAAAQWNGRCDAVYIALNPVNLPLLARASNRIVERVKITTSDVDIFRRCWLLLDFDPARPAGISATDEEHRGALARAQECLAWLRSLGFVAYILADSGNGAHILLRIDLPNDGASTDLVKHCLEAVALRFSDDRVAVDLTVYNAARIVKLYGTKACKGDDTPDRPHRVARILEFSESLNPTPRELLERLAALAPEEPKPGPRYQYSGHGSFDLQQWITAHGLDVIGPHDWRGGRKWILPVCPFNADHRNRAAVLLQFSSGAVAFRCLHNGCTGNDWHALRDHLEPGWRNGAREESENPQKDTVSDPPWPILAKEALHGLAGDIVRTIDPYTEAAQVAVLLNVLTAFGNCINSSAHATHEKTKHPARLFAVLVGDTSKGRKGTSWSTSRYLVSLCDSDWSRSRIKSGLSSGEGLIYNVRDARWGKEPIKEKGRIVGYQDVCVDEGENDKRLLIVEPEFASVLTVANRDGNTLSMNVRDAWDTGNLSPLTKNNPICATNAHVSILGHITKHELLARLDDTSKANGFANRFLWALVKRSKELPEGEAVPDEMMQPLADRLNEVITFSRTDCRVKRDDAAKALWAEVYHDLSEGKPGLLGAVLSRAEAQVLRLSVIYALLDKSSDIRVEHLQAALALWEYCERSALLIFGQKLGDPTADRILEAIRNTGEAGMSENDIYELFGKHKSANERARAIGLLLSLGLVKAEKQETGGRPRTIYRAA